MYHGRGRGRGVARMIPKRAVTPIVSWFRTRSRNSWATKYTSRMTGTYAQPCQERAIAVTDSPARRAYRMAVRSSLTKALVPARIEGRENQFSTHRRGGGRPGGRGGEEEEA